MNFNSVNVEKYAYIYTFFAFAINSFNNNHSSNCYVNNGDIEKKKRKLKKEKKRKGRRRNANCDTIKSIIFLLYTTYNCLLYCSTTVYLCSCFLVLYLIYICCYSQYSLMRKVQYCLLICVLCTRLVDR